MEDQPKKGFNNELVQQSAVLLNVKGSLPAKGERSDDIILIVLDR